MAKYVFGKLQKVCYEFDMLQTQPMLLYIYFLIAGQMQSNYLFEAYSSYLNMKFFTNFEV